MGCTNSHHNASAVDSHGHGGKSQDIDEAAMAAIKGGIEKEIAGKFAR